MIPSVPSGIRHVDGSALAGRPGGLLELALDPERIASGLALEGLRRDRTGAWWRGTEVELGRDAAGTVTVSGYGSDALRRPLHGRGGGMRPLSVEVGNRVQVAGIEVELLKPWDPMTDGDVFLVGGS